jgi:hypothetical protein
MTGDRPPVPLLAEQIRQLSGVPRAVLEETVREI